jgi:thermitase
MRAADLFKEPIKHYRESINPPYSPKDLLTIGLTIFILIVIPLTVISVNQAREPAGRAAAPVTKKAPKSVPDEILLKFKPEVTKKEKENTRKKYDLTLKRTIPKIKVEKLKVSPKARNKVIAALNKNPNVEYAEPNLIGEVLETIPNDPYFNDGSQWGPQKVEAPAAWDITTGDSLVIVAVIDTGVYRGHEDLQNKMWVNAAETPDDDIDNDNNGYIDDYYGWDFVNCDLYDEDDNCLQPRDPDNDPSDDHGATGHGTKIAGIIGAKTNNNQGIAGLSWQSPILAARVCGLDGCAFDVGAEGIIYAADNGAKVINMSWGGSQSSNTLKDAIDYAWNNGVVLVAASGNYPPMPAVDIVAYPAAFSNVVAVGATREDHLLFGNDVRASWSCYGPELDIIAPGESIYTTDSTGSYFYGNGTSYASPHGVGAAALLWAAGAASNAEVVYALYRGALDIDNSDYKHTGAAPGWDEQYGWGRLDIYQSLLKLSDPPSTTDSDGDGFSDFAEIYMGTDYNDDCGPSAWPPDFDDSQTVNILDVLQLKPHFGTSSGDTNYSPRFDLDANGSIDILDVLAMKPPFKTSCSD